MKELSLSYQKKRLSLKTPFSIAHGVFNSRDCLVLEVELNGVKGYGECTAIDYLGWKIEILEEAVLSLLNKPILVKPDANGYYQVVEVGLMNPIACALDQCLLDIYLKSNDLSNLDSLATIEKREQLVQSSYTITSDDIDSYIEKMYASKWPFLKLKMGRPFDLELLQELNSHNFKNLRIDANTAWDKSKLTKYVSLCQKLDLELIEQPFDLSTLNENRILYKETNIPVFADEIFHGLKDLHNCANYFNGINIKLQKCGGPRNALEILKQARALGMQTMIGCMTESSIGISASAQFVPYVEFADLDGAALISNDFASGVNVINGNIVYADNNGLGGRLLCN